MKLVVRLPEELVGRCGHEVLEKTPCVNNHDSELSFGSLVFTMNWYAEYLKKRKEQESRMEDSDGNSSSSSSSKKRKKGSHASASPPSSKLPKARPTLYLEGEGYCKRHHLEHWTPFNFDRATWVSTIVESITFICSENRAVVCFHTKESEPPLDLNLPASVSARLVTLLESYIDSVEPYLQKPYEAIRAFLLDVFSVRMLPLMKTLPRAPLPANFILWSLENRRDTDLLSAIKHAKSIAGFLQESTRLNEEVRVYAQRLANPSVSLEMDELIMNPLSQLTYWCERLQANTSHEILADLRNPERARANGSRSRSSSVTFTSEETHPSSPPSSPVSPGSLPPPSSPPSRCHTSSPLAKAESASRHTDLKMLALSITPPSTSESATDSSPSASPEARVPASSPSPSEAQNEAVADVRVDEDVEADENTSHATVVVDFPAPPPEVFEVIEPKTPSNQSMLSEQSSPGRVAWRESILLPPQHRDLGLRLSQDTRAEIDSLQRSITDALESISYLEELIQEGEDSEVTRLASLTVREPTIPTSSTKSTRANTPQKKLSVPTEIVRRNKKRKAAAAAAASEASAKKKHKKSTGSTKSEMPRQQKSKKRRFGSTDVPFLPISLSNHAEHRPVTRSKGRENNTSSTSSSLSVSGSTARVPTQSGDRLEEGKKKKRRSPEDIKTLLEKFVCKSETSSKPLAPRFSYQQNRASITPSSDEPAEDQEGQQRSIKDMAEEYRNGASDLSSDSQQTRCNTTLPRLLPPFVIREASPPPKAHRLSSSSPTALGGGEGGDNKANEEEYPEISGLIFGLPSYQRTAKERGRNAIKRQPSQRDLSPPLSPPAPIRTPYYPPISSTSSASHHAPAAEDEPHLSFSDEELDDMDDDDLETVLIRNILDDVDHEQEDEDIEFEEDDDDADTVHPGIEYEGEYDFAKADATEADGEGSRKRLPQLWTARSHLWNPKGSGPRLSDIGGDDDDDVEMEVDGEADDDAEDRDGLEEDEEERPRHGARKQDDIPVPALEEDRVYLLAALDDEQEKKNGERILSAALVEPFSEREAGRAYDYEKEEITFAAGLLERCGADPDTVANVARSSQQQKEVGSDGCTGLSPSRHAPDRDTAALQEDPSMAVDKVEEEDDPNKSVGWAELLRGSPQFGFHPIVTEAALGNGDSDASSKGFKTEGSCDTMNDPEDVKMESGNFKDESNDVKIEAQSESLDERALRIQDDLPLEQDAALPGDLLPSVASAKEELEREPLVPCVASPTESGQPLDKTSQGDASRDTALPRRSRSLSPSHTPLSLAKLSLRRSASWPLSGVFGHRDSLSPLEHPLSEPAAQMLAAPKFRDTSNPSL